MKNWYILNVLTFLILQVDYCPDNFLIEYRHFPHETLTQNLSSHEKWARLRAKNEIGQISSETENVAILLYQNYIVYLKENECHFDFLVPNMTHDDAS